MHKSSLLFSYVFLVVFPCAVIYKYTIRQRGCDQYYTDAAAETRISRNDTLIPPLPFMGDANGDGSITTADAYLIQLFVAEKIDTFPCEN